MVSQLKGYCQLPIPTRINICAVTCSFKQLARSAGIKTIGAISMRGLIIEPCAIAG
jgi:hypothetical protein